MNNLLEKYLTDQLTYPHKTALLNMYRNDLSGAASTSVTYGVGEALRARGYAARSSERIVRRVYADDTGEHLQHAAKAGWWRHEWYITRVGVALGAYLSDYPPEAPE